MDSFGNNMRLWTLHPKHLDTKGLLAVWREGLLAQKVLENKTTGYKNHSQLIRFKNTNDPCKAIGFYLYNIFEEANFRGYNFDREKINNFNFDDKILVTTGQISFEFEHLLNKLKLRNIDFYTKLKNNENIYIHPIFDVVNGQIENWEKTNE